MAEINWTAEAQHWLQEIYYYIAKNNSTAAKRVVEGIYQKAQLLKQFPHLGYKYDTEQEGDVRILLYGHYRMAYLIKSDGHIDILGIFHTALDIDRYL
jgi:plasmid stabilization system protein ParE